MMENYQEKYKKELYQQEINSNIHTLKGFFWIFVTILLLWLLTLNWNPSFQFASLSSDLANRLHK